MNRLMHATELVERHLIASPGRKSYFLVPYGDWLVGFSEMP